MKKKSIILTAVLFSMAVLYSLSMHLFLMQNEKDFADFVLIREGGMYTFVGSKPITHCFIMHEHAPVQLVKKAPEGAESNKEPLPGLKLTRSNFGFKGPMPIWSKWKKTHTLTDAHYSLVVQPGEGCTELYFINKALTKQTLKDHYALFSKQIGRDFDIETVVAHIDDTHSLFWTEILQGYVANGLLFGYGLENSLHFQSGYENHFQGELDQVSCPRAEQINALFMKHVTLNELPLPTFRIFSEPNAQVEKYKKERATIQAKYKNANLRKIFLSVFKRK